MKRCSLKSLIGILIIFAIMNKKSGIYKIQSRVKPERCYVGSAVDMDKRWRQHESDLRRNKHHSTKMQRHCNKYKIEDLLFEMLLSCPKEELIEKEQFFIDAYKPWFNLSPTANSRLGTKCSEESRRKMSLAKMGHETSEEHKKKISDSLIGNKHALGKHPSEETRKKLREASLGKYPSDETRRKLSEKLMGHEISEETKRKISKARMGCKVSEETRKRLSKSRMGLHPTIKSRKKMSLSKMGHEVSEETRQKISKTKTRRGVSMENREKDEFNLITNN